ncbi:MAG: carbohydrate ABC transporter permease [Thermomicrobiales bacterium]
MAREQPLGGAATAPMDAAPSLAPGRRAWFSKQLGQQVIPRIVLILVCALFILPFYWMVATALKTREDLLAYPPLFIPTELVWSNFREAVEYIPFWQYLTNTSIITVLTIIGAVISNPIIAYGFSRIDWPGRDKVFYLVLATVFIPFPVLIVALFDIFASIPRPVLDGWRLAWEGNWINTYLPLVVPMFFGQAFWIFLMRQFLMQIPHEVSDAARIDGASEFRIFYQIVLPQALPAIGVISIFAGLHAWNDFLGPLIFLQDETRYTLAIGLTFFQSQRELQFSLLMAASTLVVLPVVALFLLFQRTFVEGISLGSIK